MMRRPLPVVERPDAWPASYGDEARPRLGFFTDTTLCIGCKACEVACKEWNDVPADGYVWTGNSYDNTGGLSANTWRHVAFIEQDRPLHVAPSKARLREAEVRDGAARPDAAPLRDRSSGGAPRGDGYPPPDAPRGDGGEGMRWLMSSDVCKHCTDAACLDVCPTGALFRTEFGTVVVQQDVCNGCGYCVVACPFGVIGRREIAGSKGVGMAQKCTLCYDRTKDGLEPACAKACPTESIQFGKLDELRERASRRLEQVVARGFDGARLYGANSDDGVGGFGAFFLLLDEPEVYGLPPDPVATTRDLPSIYGWMALAAGTLGALVGLSFLGGRR